MHFKTFGTYSLIFLGCLLTLTLPYFIASPHPDSADINPPLKSESIDRLQTVFPDNQYGPVVQSGDPISACPHIPPGFPTIHRVGSLDEFRQAYDVVRPGEAIVIENGSYSWATALSKQFPKAKAGMPREHIELGRNGTATQPIYILANNIHGVEFNDSKPVWIVTGEHQVIAGMRFEASRGIYIAAPNTRVACNYFTASTGYIRVQYHSAEQFRLDNNVFDGAEGIAVALLRCDPTRSACTSNSKGAHIHHNTWKNKPNARAMGNPNANGHEAIMLGLDYMPDRNKENTIHNVDGSNLDAIVENNLFDGWNGENELISIKSSRNILRHNCVLAAPAASFNIRSGNNNLITGNWFASAGKANISGHKNTIVFNYHGSGGGHSPWLFTNGISAHDGQRPRYEHLYVYPPAIDNIVESNVVNQYRYALQSPFELGGFSYTSSHPKGNSVRNNVFYSPEFSGTGDSGGYRHVARTMTEARFRSVNRFGPNEIRNTLLPNTSCGDASLFEGPGGRNASIQGHAGLLGGERVITAPSWWAQ